MKTNLSIIKFASIVMFTILTQSAYAQTLLSLQYCRSMALENNSQSKIAEEKVRGAEYDKKAAFANYLPKVSATGMYLRNSNNLSLISTEQSAALSGIGTTLTNDLNAFIGKLMLDPNFRALYATDNTLQYMLGVLNGTDIEAPLNAIGKNISDEFQLDIQNVYVGMVSVEEPLYAGGKIRAYNKVAAYAKELAETQMEGENQKILVTADEAYWQIVSISNKLKLTEKYVELLRKLYSDVDKMREQGVATTSDKLSVSLKLNEAEMTLLKAQNGLILSKMLLCQLCGLDLHSDIVLKDELNEDLVLQPDTVIYNPENLEENRSELKSLTLATHMYNQKVNIVRSDFLPTIAVMGNYMITNPSLNNGLSNKAGDMWNIGVVAKIPLFHFGEGMNKVRKAKSDALISQYQLDDAKGKVSLQVEQYERQISEANSRLTMSTVLMENAEENLRMAKLGFQEGVTSSSDVLAAHTAWLQAHSEEIDAKIERIMANVYLRQATGQLNNNK